MKFHRTALALTHLIHGVCAIWPAPSQVSTGSAVLYITESVPVTYTPHNSTAAHFALNEAQSQSTGLSWSEQVVRVAIRRTHTTLFSQNFVPWKFHPRFSNFEPPASSGKNVVVSIALVQNATDPKDAQRAQDGGIQEGYTLALTKAGKVTITAPSSIGLAHGLTTFTQLFYAHTGGGVYTGVVPVKISDTPKFAHRGLNLDVARSWYPVADILRTIDALAYNKFNRLHLHITDAQSWPLDIPAMPNLSGKGAYGPNLSYSPAEVSHIQQFGALRGVQVFLEIDMPGHTSAIAYAYPDLIAAFDERDWSKYAAEPQSGTLRLNSSAVYNFLDTLWKDLLPRLKPYTAYMHTGGDEVNFEAYTLDPTVNSSSPAVLQPLIQKFIDYNHNKIRAAGLTPVVWEEVLLNYNVTLGSDVLVQSWTSTQAVGQIAAANHKVIAGNYEFWYLDCGHGQWLDFAPGQASQSFFPYLDYCDPLKNWRLIYSYNPLQGVPASKQHLVLGGEVSMWSEQTDPVNVDRNLWPRAAAAGEVLWSGPLAPNGQNRSQITASPRLSEMRERLVARGVMAEPIRMPMCTMDPDNDPCALYN